MELGFLQGIVTSKLNVNISATHDSLPSCLEHFHLHIDIPWSAPGCRTGNGKKQSISQAEPGQAIKSAVAYFPSISCATSWRRSRYILRIFVWLPGLLSDPLSFAVWNNVGARQKGDGGRDRTPRAPLNSAPGPETWIWFTLYHSQPKKLKEDKLIAPISLGSLGVIRSYSTANPALETHKNARSSRLTRSGNRFTRRPTGRAESSSSLESSSAAGVGLSTNAEYPKTMAKEKQPERERERDPGEERRHNAAVKRFPSGTRSLFVVHISTQLCRFLSQEVGEKHRATVASSGQKTRGAT